MKGRSQSRNCLRILSNVGKMKIKKVVSLTRCVSCFSYLKLTKPDGSITVDVN